MSYHSLVRLSARLLALGQKKIVHFAIIGAIGGNYVSHEAKLADWLFVVLAIVCEFNKEK